MRLRLETALACPAEAAWRAEREVATLGALSAPLLTVTGAGGAALPRHWREGTTVTVESRLFGRLPLGVQTIVVAEFDDARRSILTRECGTWIKRWDHRLTIESRGPSASACIDDIRFGAGLLGPLLWPLAWVFYRYRGLRRRRLLAPPRPAS